MKKLMIFVVAALCLMMTACGGNEDSGAAEVDLQAYYDTVKESYQWDDNYMVNIEGEMLDGYYPGLSEVAAVQFIAKMPMMSAVVNELVFMQCETEEDAAAAAEILQTRINMQAEGGAWYPESIAAWEKGQVIQHGAYVAMIASAEYQDEIAQSFNDLFA